MDNQNLEKVSSATEIPISDLKRSANSSKIPFDISKVRVKTAAIGLIVVLAVLGGIFVVSKFFAKSTKKTVINAQQATYEGKYTDAKKLYQEELTKKKNDPEALAGLINTISLDGNQSGTEKKALAESQQYINTALSTSPNNVNVLIAAGYAYETAGDYQKAYEYYSKATSVNPKSSDAWFHLGHASQFLGKDDEAKKDFDTAYSLDKNNPAVLMELANESYSANKLEDAFQYFKKASEIPSQTLQSKTEALVGAATVRGLQDNYQHIDESVSLAELAVRLNPTYSPALAIYGYDLYLIGNKADGVKYLKRATVLNPRVSKTYYILGLIYRKTNDNSNAIDSFKKAVATADDDNTMYTVQDRNTMKGYYEYDLARTYDLVGVKDGVVDLISDSVRINPTIKPLVAEDVNQKGYFKNLTSDLKTKSLL
ncbi:MAG TPA: tetratricopeptide repeat protein [Patescibacteria group bacterium]|nr:tetratricopeptide repeat protein [Patescibacteria group bacterium]